MHSRESQYDGVLLLDKPSGMTSHDVVDAVRRIYGTRRVGHTGTLDPLAEGLLVMCIGRATRIAQFLSDATKEYVATIEFGKTSPTYDAEGIDDLADKKPVEIDETKLHKILERFHGSITQTVPAYSAVKVNGERLHKATRQGKEVDRPTRQVTIHELEIIELHDQQLRIRVACSKGTYIRCLAHDIGQAYGCGAFLTSLRRTAVDKLRLEDAVALNSLQEIAEEGRQKEWLLEYERVLDLPPVRVKPEYESAIRQGRDVTLQFVASADDFHRGDRVMLTTSDGAVLAIMQAECDASQITATADQRLFSYSRVLV